MSERERESRRVRREREGERLIPEGTIVDRGYVVEDSPRAALGDRLHSFEERLQALETRLAALPTATAATSASPASWLGPLLQGVTLVSIIGAAFWLGGMSNKIDDHSTKIDKLSGVVLESRDSLSSRMGSVEAKLDSIDKKLDALSNNSKAKKGD